MGQSASQPKSAPCDYESESDSDYDSQDDQSFSSDDNDSIMDMNDNEIEKGKEIGDKKNGNSETAGAAPQAQDEPTTPVKPLQDLLTMSDEELKICLQRNEPTTRELILARSQLLEDDVLGVFGWYHDFIQINKVDGTVDESGRSHTDIAMFLLSISPELRSIRFKMVPAKLSESHFWGSVFSLLQDAGTNMITTTTSSPNHLNGGGSGGGSDRNEFSKKLLVEKDAEITVLRKKLAAAETAIKELKTNSSKHQETKGATHGGKWVVDKDCQEFLSLDQETRDKLREGKKKRLEDVLEQMKFILDGDTVSFTRGKWDCCGQTSYYTDKCN